MPRPLPFATLGLLVLLAACSSATATPAPMPAAPGFAVDPAIAPAGLAPFPECQADEYAFVGESSLAALGLGDFGGGPDANRTGMIWITANPVAPLEPAPVGAGQLGEVRPQRWVCVQWPDGSGMSGPVPDDWVPSTQLASDPSTEPTPAIPLGTIAVLVGAITVVGVSFVAFRREGSRSAGEGSSA